MTLDELTLETAINEAGQCEDVRISKEFAERLLDLLKEQEAVVPILKREGRNKYFNDYICPICDSELTYEQNYCSGCGRKVKWE